MHRKQNAMQMSYIRNRLITIQPSPQIPCTPHKLLILMLLHLQLPLSLYTNGPHASFSLSFPVSLLSDVHAL